MTGLNRRPITLVNKDFGLMRKNVCFWCIFGRWIRIYFQNFSITHTFRSRLNGWNLLRQDTNVCFYRGRHEVFKDFFSQGDSVVFCNYVCSIMDTLDNECNPDEWRLFIDSSKASLKVVLLHNGNKFPSVPSSHTVALINWFVKSELQGGSTPQGK